MNNILQMIQQLNQFKQSLNGKDPEKMVKELMSQGKMSNDQFQQLSQMANQFKGFFK